MTKRILESTEDVTRAVMCAIRTRPDLNMDELILCCRPYTWNQVFLALDHLVKKGVVTLKQGGGFYMTSLSLAHKSRHGRRELVAHGRPS